MVNQELDDERKELMDLAERVGYLGPPRASTGADQGNSPNGSKKEALGTGEGTAATKGFGIQKQHLQT